MSLGKGSSDRWGFSMLLVSITVQVMVKKCQPGDEGMNILTVLMVENHYVLQTISIVGSRDGGTLFFLLSFVG